MQNQDLRKPRSNRCGVIALASLLTSTALCGAAMAQEGDDVEEIVVVGKHLYSDQINSLKAPTPIIDVPQSLSIVTADQISQRGFDSVGQIINYTPGVSTSMGEGHRDAVVFRGVRSTADFFIDGMRDDVQYYRPLYNLEQVEILRGPNALLFGRGGTGGILNRVTKKAVNGEVFASYKADIDTFGGLGFQLDVNQTENETTALRINAMFEALDGHRDYFDGQRFGFNPTVNYQLSPNTTFDVSYEYVNHERFIDRGIPTGADGKPVKAFEDIVFGDPDLNTTKLEAHLFRITLQHEFAENLKGIFSAFYGDYDKLYQNFYVSSYDELASPDEVTLDGYVDTTERQNLILSANLIGEFSSGVLGHTIVAGAEYIDTSSDQDRFNAFWDTTSDDNEVFTVSRSLGLINGSGLNALGVPTTNDFTVDLNDDTRVGVQVFSAYVQDQIELTDWLQVVGGVRYDNFDIEVLNVPVAETRTRTDEEFSPRAGLILKPRQNVSIYASYSEAFLPRSGEQFANINGSNNQLDPDEFTNLEAGVKWDITPLLSLTAAVFEIEKSSPQVSDNDPATLDVIDSEIQGFEVQLEGTVLPQWFVSAGYSYLDGEQIDRFGPTGLRPIELPEHMFSIWNSYQATDKLSFGIGLTYQDESYVNNSNSAVLPSYARFDAAVLYAFSDTLSFQMNIENLTNELYFPNAHSTHQVAVGAPFNVKFGVKGKF